MRLVRPPAHEREDDDGPVGHKDALIQGEERAVGGRLDSPRGVALGKAPGYWTREDAIVRRLALNLRERGLPALQVQGYGLTTCPSIGTLQQVIDVNYFKQANRDGCR